MTDAQATSALNAAFSNPAILRRQLKLNRKGVGPGHFGWLNTRTAARKRVHGRKHRGRERRLLQ